MNTKEWSRFEASLVSPIPREFGFANRRGRISISLQKAIFQKAGTKFPTNLHDLLVTRPHEVGDESLPPKKRVPFGHLIVQLPSHYTGGNLRFRHEGREEEFDMSADMTTQAGWTPTYLAYYPHLDQNHDEILSGCEILFNLQFGNG